MAESTENNVGNGAGPDPAKPYVSKSGRVLSQAQVAAMQKNLKPRQKGQPPPKGAGRPKGRTILACLKDRLDEPVRRLLDQEQVKAGRFPKQYLNKKVALAIADVMIRAALTGNFQFAKEIIECMYGKAPAQMDVTSGGQTIKVVGIPLPEPEQGDDDGDTNDG
jgi:hypothetical protein